VIDAIVPDAPSRYFHSRNSNSFCREAEMIDLKKKYWREKVTAEITVAHMLQFARELGANMNAAEVAAFLNQKGRAQGVWMHMMQAGEEYIKSSLEANPLAVHSAKQTASHAGRVQ
jgi:hypothetical protein